MDKLDFDYDSSRHGMIESYLQNVSVTAYRDAYETAWNHQQKKLDDVMEKHTLLECKLIKAINSLEYINDVAPSMHEYNQIELNMVSKAREALKELKE